ncbi:sensory neuron membrane protein 1-like isoform X1 [Onthophagus taurus]|uniref:sensory neuron membrane protein 1-like isoform X1 n=1 Tax=Onthophagus taurus TaxID=166361 RepID=UPI0039BE5D6C
MVKESKIRNLIFCVCCPKLSFILKLYQRYQARKENIKMHRPLKIGVGCGIMLTCMTIFGFVAFPNLIKAKIKAMVNLKEGTDVRDIYLKLPFPLMFKIYPFNLTNPDEVVKGAKPILKEVGPYVFEEWREKVLIAENEIDDTMTFYAKETFIYRQDLSGGLTGNEIITIPHPLIMAIALTVIREKPAMISLVTKALNSIFSQPQTPFLTATVNQIFFDGIIINCTVTDFPGKALCTELKTEAKQLQVVADKIYKFSLMGAKNGSATEKFKVKRGIQNYKETGRLLEYNDQAELTIWGSKECNQFRGTEGTIFPALPIPKADIPSFAYPLCRVVDAKYDSKTKYDGIPVNKYVADFGDQSSNPDDKCYCPSQDECMKKGALDLRKCAGPIVVTLPHFLDADPEYQNGVTGMNPDKDIHQLHILFEANSGSPLSARNRIQFNFPLMKIDKLKFLKDVPEVLVPLFWVEESIDLQRDLTGPIKMLYTAKTVVKILTWLSIVASIGGLSYAGYITIKKGHEVEITPVKAGSTKNDNISMVLSNNDKGHVNHAMSDNEINNRF